MECPTCCKSVTKAAFLKEDAEWIIGIPDKDVLYGCFKIMSNYKLIPYHGLRRKWRRKNGRLVALDMMDMNLDIFTV